MTVSKSELLHRKFSKNVPSEEQLEEWFNNQRKRDEQALINRDLDLLSELC